MQQDLSGVAQPQLPGSSSEPHTGNKGTPENSRTKEEGSICPPGAPEKGQNEDPLSVLTSEPFPLKKPLWTSCPEANKSEPLCMSQVTSGDEESGYLLRRGSVQGAGV